MCFKAVCEKKKKILAKISEFTVLRVIVYLTVYCDYIVTYVTVERHW